MEMRHLKPYFDQICLGQVAFPFYSPRDEDSIRRTMEKSDVVINMIGKYYQTKHAMPKKTPDGKSSRINYSFEEVNVEIPARLARLAKEMGLPRFVHVSALASDPDSPSLWARTKYQGELAVRAEFPEATIVRPAIMFGPEDKFLNHIAKNAKMLPNIPFLGGLPLVNNGDALIQPVDVRDVAKALCICAQDDEDKLKVDVDVRGKTLDLAGPDDFTWREVAEFVKDVTDMTDTKLFSWDESVARAAGRVLAELPNPRWTEDMALQQSTDQILDPATPNLTFKDLGIKPTPMEKVAFMYLHRYRQGGHFILAEGYHNYVGQEGK